MLLARFGPDKGDWTLAVTHLSLGVTSRRVQLTFLAELLSDCQRLVLMGDFNCAAEAAEMQVLYRRTRLRPPPHKPPTFPSWAPSRGLDHVLSGGLALEQYRTVVAAGSDHLGVAAEVRLH